MKQSMVPGLETLRRERGVSRAEFAELLGVHQASIYGWETGAWAPRLENLLKMARAFDVSPNDLLEWDERAMDARTKRYVNEMRPYLN